MRRCVGKFDRKLSARKPQRLLVRDRRPTQFVPRRLPNHRIAQPSAQPINRSHSGKAPLISSWHRWDTLVFERAQRAPAMTKPINQKFDHFIRSFRSQSLHKLVQEHCARERIQRVDDRSERHPHHHFI
jgi:hypothetical protein